MTFQQTAAMQAKRIPDGANILKRPAFVHPYAGV
jgi:hypothetical protein